MADYFRLTSIFTSLMIAFTGILNHSTLPAVIKLFNSFENIREPLYACNQAIFDRFDLIPHYIEKLDEIAQMLTQNPTVKAQIHGHTDYIGTAQYNQDLSEKRAWAVKNYFMNKGVVQIRLFLVGFGYRRNNASNENKAGRALNRILEIVLQN